MEQIFAEHQRKVFAYCNGTSQVYGDPLAIFRKIVAAFDGDPNPTLTAMVSPEVALWAAATERMLPIVREVFQMVPFDPATGLGASDSMVLDALVAWQGWMNEKKGPAAS